MKSAYELAMERLGKSSPAVTLTGKQKAEIAELESRCKAKLAERERQLRGRHRGVSLCHVLVQPGQLDLKLRSEELRAVTTQKDKKLGALDVLDDLLFRCRSLHRRLPR